MISPTPFTIPFAPWWLSIFISLYVKFPSLGPEVLFSVLMSSLKRYLSPNKLTHQPLQSIGALGEDTLRCHTSIPLYQFQTVWCLQMEQLQ